MNAAAEAKNGARNAYVRSAFIFLFNYLVFVALCALFTWLNAVALGEGHSLAGYVRENFTSVAALLCSLFVLCVIVWFYYFFERRQKLLEAKSVWLIFILLETGLVVCYFFGYFFNIYSRPVAMLALLALMLLGRRDAIFLNVIFALLLYSCDYFTNFTELNRYAAAMVSTPLIVFSAGMVAVFVGSKVKTRLRSLLTGFAICLPVVILIACLEYSRGQGIWYLLLFGLEAGIVSAVLFMALLPMFESVFNCVTDYRLRELSDHDAPLIRELKEKAPGTFNHSIVVAHLSEACAIALGENAALARAAAYYHDVGKLRQPEYFAENQAGYNPHNELSPELSVDIIRSHAKDGSELIRSKHLPKVLADVAIQHHGTLPIKFFYAKALKMTDGEVDIEDFSYSGPKPQTKIAAIVMIADASEAISRTLPDRTPEKVENAVREIIEERMDLDQFTECDVTMRDLSTIKEAIVSCLTGVYHSRVQYPKLTLKRKDEKQHE